MRRLAIKNIKMRLLAVILTTLPFLALADQGTAGGGGGDISEIGVYSIRKDILQWVNEGKSKDLVFPAGLSHDEYVTKMKKQLQPNFVVVSFVTTEQENNTTDPEQQVIVDGFRKSCRGFISKKDDRPHILCNSDRFPADGPSQYRLIHHEYAGLAGLEKNQGASSDYILSDQISNKLTPDLVYRLCPESSTQPKKKYGFLRNLFWIYHQQQPTIQVSSLETEECDGKILLTDPSDSSVIAEASGTWFTTRPSGQARCNENYYVNTQVAIQSYELPNNLQLVVTLNSNTNYHHPSTQVGDIFLISYGNDSSLEKPTIIAKCEQCSLQIEAEIKRSLGPQKYGVYERFNEQHALKQIINSEVDSSSGELKMTATIGADFAGVGCWWDPGELKLPAKLEIVKVGSLLKVRIDSARLSGDLKSCHSPKP